MNDKQLPKWACDLVEVGSSRWESEYAAAIEATGMYRHDRANFAGKLIEKCQSLIGRQQTPFDNDPFAVVAAIYSEMFPNFPMPIILWAEGLHVKDGDPWAQTFVPDDDGDEITIGIDVTATVGGAVELLAHELAHVACEHLGLCNEEHGQHWQDCFDEINARYLQLLGE